jgi:penicillin amidase
MGNVLLKYAAGKASDWDTDAMLQSEFKDGDFTMPGLSERVKVSFNEKGTPHIQAQNMADLLMAEGFLHASMRMWQMFVFRKVSRGELADLFGPEVVNGDVFARTAGWARTGAADWVRYSRERAENKSDDSATELCAADVLTHYVAGVNAYLQTPGRCVVCSV